jgi:MYXO-CTERM domain-containing protein
MGRAHVKIAAAVLSAAAVVLVSPAARAHFVLQSPPSWAEQDAQGNPQKSAPCGQADPQIAVAPTNVVTSFVAGETITISVRETTFHPGHYRVVLSPTGQASLPSDPTATPPGTCEALDVQDPPVYPVLADGMLRHAEPFDEPSQSFEVTLPSDVECSRCTLQVLEFMSAEVGGGGNCFYHHCADVSIASPAPDGEGDRDGGCACTTGGAAGSPVLSWLWLVVVGLLRRTTRTTRRGLLAMILVVIAGCGDDRPTVARFGVSPGDVELKWLARVGTGPAQTAAACARGAADPVARALCRSPAPAITGLDDLYQALDLTVANGRMAAVATQSLGLSARTVSALNPRTIVFPAYSPLQENGIVAAAFSRGEPFVEMVGYDPNTNDFNFYLLAFEWRDLLSEELESGWGGWTLYTDHDLEDTPLDCTSCHRPDGPGARRRLLMRQFDYPWLQWGDFRGLPPPVFCTDDSGATTLVDVGIEADGAELLRAIDGELGRHGGIPVANLLIAHSGYDLSSFVFYSAGIVDGPGDVPCSPPDCPFAEPYPFPSQDVLCDQLRHGRADVAGGAWARYREQVSARGIPVPFFAHDLLDAGVRATIAADFDGFIATSAARGDAFTLLSGLVGENAARAIGFLPDEDDAAPALLAKMCGRCHGPSADPHLARARFDAFALDHLDAATARHVLERIALPRTSPDRMPPLRSGELPDWAVVRIQDFLRPAL